MFSRKYTHALVALLTATALLTGAAVAQEDGDEEDEGGGVDIEIDIGAIVDAIEDLADELTDFTGSWDETLADVLTAVLFRPFKLLAEKLVNWTALVLTTTPQVHPNPAVEKIHGQALAVSVVLTGFVFIWAGILHIIGPILGISYTQVRAILPRVLIAVALAAVSPPFLQLLVDLSDALVYAFSPRELDSLLPQLAGLSTGLVIVWLVQSILLLKVVALFIIRDVYILFFAAASPLFFITWSIPRFRRYADTFIAGFFAALLIGPLDVLALRFSLALLEGTGGTAIQSLSNWVLGIASFLLLLIIPYQVWGASQTAVSSARSVTSALQKNRGGSSSSSTGSRTMHGLSEDEVGRLKRNALRRRNSSTDYSYKDFKND
jgi:hypothetical protein